jgi:predicted membrane-bound dolichyl-phosphate-mannose-protein mannosyltransferase
LTRAAPREAAGGIAALLILGLGFRLIIAALLPGSGFNVDIVDFSFWASNLAREGLHGFYQREFFHDYTPGYLYVLWFMGVVGGLIGHGVTLFGNTYGLIDLLKLPPILCDVGLAYVVWSMARELGAGERAAKLGAFIVVINPVTWFDSVLWGQADSVGVLVMLLALRELWRDRPERSAVLTMVAALIKPQLGILIPIVAAVTIRRALWPDGAFGSDDPDEVRAARATGWERRTTGWIRIVTTGVAGLATAFVLSLPFGLSLPGLVGQIFSTAAGYPYLSLNAYNPWALVSQDGNGIAANRLWVCDSTITPSGPFEIRIGDWLLYNAPASTLSCPNGLMIGAIPAAVLGAVLFLAATALVVWLVARRPDRRTMLVGLAVLALAFFVLPTRVHERYLYPLVGVGAILAAFSLRWRVAYAVACAGMLSNMYAVLTTLYPNNPQISDWFRIGAAVTSYEGVAAAAIAQTVVFGWAFLQLRDDPLDELQDDLETAEGQAGPSLPGPIGDAIGNLLSPAPSGRAMTTAAEAPGAPAPPTTAVVAPGAVMPAWEDRDAGVGPLAWLAARFRDRPIRPDRSAALEGEAGGRLDRLDLWLIAVLVLSLATVRFWRLAEPYDMHFDEVYHPRTAMEFLQDWRYGMWDEIYEWTHPHLAKYAMALGIVALADDRTEATADLSMPGLRDATVEGRWNDLLHERAGDRLWVVGADQVRAYDLATRALVANWPLPGASAVSIDPVGHRAFVGTASGEIWTIDGLALDSLRATGTPVGGFAEDGAEPAVQPEAWVTVEAPITRLMATDDGAALAAVTAADAGTGRSLVITLDLSSATEVGRVTLRDVRQLADAGETTSSPPRHVVAIAAGEAVAFVDTATGKTLGKVALDGAVGGVAATSGLQDDPLYASVLTADGPRITLLTTKSGETVPSKSGTQFDLPGDTAGIVAFDRASKMVHVVGSAPSHGGFFPPSAPAGSPTVYVIEPHANAVYADAPLPLDEVALTMDDSPDYPASDRQQLLAFSADGQMAAVPIGRHAFSWRVPGVIAGILMGALVYVLARLLFRRREVAVAAGVLLVADGMLFVQSRIGMNDSYVGLFIVAAYVLFAWLWLKPGGSRRRWIAWAIGMPVIGLTLGLALAAKWVAAYAIGGLGILVLGRSALGRLVLLAGLVGATTFLGYLAISVPEGTAGGNYVFLAIMIGLTLAAVVASVLHPIAWTWEEQRLAVYGPMIAGAVVVVGSMATGRQDSAFTLVGFKFTILEVGFAAIALGVAMYTLFAVAGRIGFGPMALPPAADDPAALLDPPAPAPRGWLNLGAGFGLPAMWTLTCLIAIPVVVYVVSYIPWAWVDNHQLLPELWPGWPGGHDGTGAHDTLLNLTGSMYDYHNNLTTPHPAASPWWAWPFDLKPVWFYQESFAGGTTASIYDAGNLVAWWLAVPAMAFVAWQAFRRRSVALGLIGVGFAVQWLSWARIDRAAFQYHYYTAVPFLLVALAYFIAELWNGPSWRTWVLARLAGAAAVLGPFLFWLLHRPLCAVAQVELINKGSTACPTTIPDLMLSPRTIAIAVVVGLGVLLLLRLFLSAEDEAGGSSEAGGRWLASRFIRAAAIGVSVVAALSLVSLMLPADAGLKLTAVPVEPIAVIVTLALLPVAAFVATARDSRRFALGMLTAVGLWFVAWYPNIAALPLPSQFTNVYQGVLPSYLYSFQFWVNTTVRGKTEFANAGVAFLLVAVGVIAIAVAYSTWTWRIALAERRREAAAWTGEEGAGSTA